MAPPLPKLVHFSTTTCVCCHTDGTGAAGLSVSPAQLKTAWRQSQASSLRVLKPCKGHTLGGRSRHVWVREWVRVSWPKPQVTRKSGPGPGRGAPSILVPKCPSASSGRTGAPEPATKPEQAGPQRNQRWPAALFPHKQNPARLPRPLAGSSLPRLAVSPPIKTSSTIFI